MQHYEAINILCYHDQHPILPINGTLSTTDSDNGTVLKLKIIPAPSIDGRPSHFKKETNYYGAWITEGECLPCNALTHAAYTHLPLEISIHGRIISFWIIASFIQDSRGRRMPDALTHVTWVCRLEDLGWIRYFGAWRDYVVLIDWVLLHELNGLMIYMVYALFMFSCFSWYPKHKL